ncbi:4-alpha-glucanotransferase [Puniceicoccales bacterium CK1056]|uniref:4-alpha-glucanotransferase n=1 Tax=Oceanipulchritudo coccoides TaxID=2706888 RepID=A0A6B2M3V6_9BACT|nr:4-alpha-glucanotransferase [Oceanipulchritudo coccoides]NDV62982.1 4-alpha-glucanotransferase [Oceanipulchritudo coccoides]
MAPAKSLAWLKDRSAGVLLHPTSLHGNQGIGVLGAEARQFVYFLKESGFKYWQVLPLGPTGFGDSPYSSFSAFAGNPYLIDLVPLLEYGLLKPEDLHVLQHLPHDHTDFGMLYRIKWPLLRLAHKRFVESGRAYLPNYGIFADFIKAESDWLEPYCAYMALKERFNGTFWGEWPPECRKYPAARKSKFWKETKQAREAHAFFQYLFFGQWQQLKAHANEFGIEIIGDTPIFVALDSADTWASPELFEMSKPAKPDFVAGVPPDYFSETGQLWGNPLYNWEAHKKDNFKWWVHRLEANFKVFDIVRLDHFRGFYDYWRIPARAEDARSGKWATGPKDALFKEVARKLPSAKLIAEDLGEIHDKIRNFRDRLGLPGMAILQFAFGGKSDNFNLPHNLIANSVVYPGTHDNNTSVGWYDEASPQERDHARRYLRVDGDDFAWDLIRECYQSISRLAIVPMQDIMSLGSSARMNSPGEEQGNWQWRMEENAFNETWQSSSTYLAGLADLYGR